MITLSEDSYVRLTLVTFRNTPLTHLLSGLDENGAGRLSQGASLCVISGYTEWVSTTIPAITVGWDWRLDVSHGRPLCVRVGPPRSNVMFLDERGDIGTVATAALLEAAIDAADWQNETLEAIGTRYS